jgi:hypothetical protein
MGINTFSIMGMVLVDLDLDMPFGKNKQNSLATKTLSCGVHL